MKRTDLDGLQGRQQVEIRGEDRPRRERRRPDRGAPGTPSPSPATDPLQWKGICSPAFRGRSGVPPGEALTRYVRAGEGRPPGPGRLLAWDANSIHAFVFDTTNATGIRGASDVLRGIDGDLRDGTGLGLAQGQVLFSGGGSGLAVVSADEIEPVRERLHALFARRTRIATCTVADADLGQGEGGFNERVREVGRALARDRVLTGPDAEPAVPFFAERCQVCGRRAAAVVKARKGAEEGRAECAPCHDRIEQGKRNLRYQGEPSGFEHIADGEGERQGFYAVLYLDGNGIGRTITGLGSPLAYATFSRVLGTLLGDTFHDIARRYGLNEDQQGGTSLGSFQLPICGGDDVVAILPGNVAVPFARDLVARLEGAADAEPAFTGHPIGASAGIAIGHATFPVRHLLAEAEGLLRAAKRRVYDSAEVRSALAFSVVTDGSPRIASAEPDRWGRAAGELLLSGVPYSAGELETFSRRFRLVRAAAKVGRTQLYALQSHALHGPRRFRNHVLYQIARRPEWADLTLALSGEGKALLRDPDACERQFAPTYGGRQVFDIGDMIELLGHWREPGDEGDRR